MITELRCREIFEDVDHLPRYKVRRVTAKEAGVPNDKAERRAWVFYCQGWTTYTGEPLPLPRYKVRTHTPNEAGLYAGSQDRLECMAWSVWREGYPLTYPE